ncbi:hypothetical protein TNIN_12271 [Trichonephila inaurata madagascariensis]|uniref:Uncharacterized protein n=1 Tax=Trichonephila inaurata madagascariensis TaxID=2747483 RepID=A0A8X6Y2D9_9ARAC|nr:hypothetical protein TNIN_12271 [Trichonephila inaurata madagascariensis]
MLCNRTSLGIEFMGQGVLFMSTGLSSTGREASFEKGILKLGFSPKYQKYLRMSITIPKVLRKSKPKRVRLLFVCGKKIKSIWKVHPPMVIGTVAF